MGGYNEDEDVLILGGGLTGLSAGYVLTGAGCKVRVFEAAPSVGGLSKTIERDGFRFDLGGHRFFTTNKDVDSFVRGLMQGELLTVARKSKILLRGKFFDYPLKPLNSVFGLGASTTARILADYGKERLKALFFKQGPEVSLEDWVVRNFGRTMFDIYFKQYSEKVWGIGCKRISREWVSKRINGLSLGGAVKSAFFKFSGKGLPTLADSFVYPELGIGRISERLKAEIEKAGIIEKGNSVSTGSPVSKVVHRDFRVESVEVRGCNGLRSFRGREVISSIPVTSLVRALSPAAPEEVIDAARSLGYRDLVIAALMIDRPSVTDQTWIYVPEKSIPFGRIHEPKNWSPKMAPEGKTLLVIEYFCFKGDDIWNSTDEDLARTTAEHLERLGFIKKSDVMGCHIVRVPKAYPLFEVGYEKHMETITGYLSRFKNLHTAGRGGLFRYYNMDHAIESGIGAARDIMRKEGK